MQSYHKYSLFSFLPCIHVHVHAKSAICIIVKTILQCTGYLLTVLNPLRDIFNDCVLTASFIPLCLAK